MADQSPFEPRPPSRLEQDQIVNYLLQQKQRGYQVYQAAGNGRYELLLDDMHRISFGPPNNGITQVQGYALNSIVQWFDVTSFREFEMAVNSLAARMIGASWQGSSPTGRLSEATPATNFTTISNLIGSGAVQAIFDPYLENRSLAALIDILSFGAGSVANGVKVLSTNKTTGGAIPRLSKVGFDAWLAQLGIQGEIRLMGPSEHRRFLLVSGGQSLLIGSSLNSLHKNEAIRLESDKEDRTFFDSVWAKASPLT